MTTINKLVLRRAALALALSLTAGAYAQNTEDKGRATDSDLGGRVTADWPAEVNRDRILGEHSAISAFNKASSLIGMDVRNLQNERLGEIKDLVVDLDSGKVAYAVLSVGGFLGIGDKYIAVPPAAFTRGADHDRLVLNADKAKIENAPGFAKNNWPAVDSSTWRADTSYWMPSGTAQGTLGRSQSETGVGKQTDADLEFRSQPSSRLDVDQSTGRDTFRGRIIKINPENRTMTIEGASGTREFKFDDKPTITLKDSRNPRISDLKVGFPVVVGYSHEGGEYVAHSVIRSDTPEVR